MSTKSKFVATVLLFVTALAVAAGVFFLLASDPQPQEANVSNPSTAASLNDTSRHVVDAGSGTAAHPAVGNRSSVGSSHAANGLRENYRDFLASSSNKSEVVAEERSNIEDSAAMATEESPGNKTGTSQAEIRRGATEPLLQATRVTTAETGKSPANNATKAASIPRLWLPAAMLEPDDSIAISTEMQVAAWEELQNNFVDAVNGQIPSDEAGRANWIEAQQENDDLFRLKFGWEAFNAQQLKAYREGLAPRQP